jgi:hypothetical protein
MEAEEALSRLQRLPGFRVFMCLVFQSQVLVDVKNCPALLSSSQLLNNAEKAAAIQIVEAALFFKILCVTGE